ncbi:hypothetical protein ZOSMA_64G00930 [Zostera marina]|uniref:Leucine-rich repeat-containing N-terminal plant-type domain-containing protein n=1 Tax=Zostera marina TaxID=29655 RepID=A0A0K9NSV2_ZOSMR|nr:hypothetical protein ZOSMA_64G00930 [Zostera marina]
MWRKGVAKRNHLVLMTIFYAINNLYTALGSPSVPGWIPNAGDPCADGWQGVQCVGPNITAIILNDADLGGELGENLGIFTSIIMIDLSNNRISGSIPENLPITLRELNIQNNQLSGTLDVLQYLPLNYLNVENNLFSGFVPTKLASIPNFR